MANRTAAARSGTSTPPVPATRTPESTTQTLTAEQLMGNVRIVEPHDVTGYIHGILDCCNPTRQYHEPWCRYAPQRTPLT